LETVGYKISLGGFSDFFEDALQKRVDLRFHPVMMPALLLVMVFFRPFSLRLRVCLRHRMWVPPVPPVMTAFCA